MTPLRGKLHTVALRTRTPHCRTFRTVEHTELYGRAVGHNSHHSAKRIYLPDYLTFGYSANGRITAHLGYFVHIQGDKQRVGAKLCRSVGSLTSGMPGTNHYDIKFVSHLLSYISSINPLRKFSLYLSDIKYIKQIFGRF
jgi:hypothetical protein